MLYSPEMPQLEQFTCPKCAELGREFADAARQHVRLIKEQERRPASDSAQSQELDPEIQRATIWRESVRAGIRIHLAVDHANEPSLTMAVPG
jgi:hypothetical protein